MKNKKTITIGISAFNEAENIKSLIKSLLKQKLSGFVIERILVISDGSTDNTVARIKKIKNPKIRLIRKRRRLGKMIRQNEIISRCNSDILIILDADVIPMGSLFVKELIKPIIKTEHIGIVGANIVSISGKNRFEKIISDSTLFKKYIYEEVNNGNNIYTCNGRARAFSKEFYKQLMWVNVSPEDAFSYLTCISKNFIYRYAPRAKVLFKSPTKFSDHAKQSIRFEVGKKNLEKYFSKDFIERQYKIPPFTFLKALVIFLLKNTFYTVFYVVIKLYLLLFKKNQAINLTTWDVAHTSKKVLNYEK